MSYQSNIVNLIKVRNGVNGANYFFEITPKEIKKYYNDAETIDFLDKTITLKVKDKAGKEKIFYSGKPAEDNQNVLYVETILGVITEDGIKNIVLKSTIMSGDKLVKEISIDDFEKYKVSDDYDDDDFFGNKTYLDVIKEYECFLVFELYEYKNEVSSLILTDAMIISWALNKEYARFQVTAMAIQGSVDDAGFKFDNNGLTISNGKNKGGITIKNKVNNNEVVFSANTDGNVFLKGEIEAKSGLIGEIEIANGGLTGTEFKINNEGITANSGRFGQFTISNGSIIACRQDDNVLNGFELSADGVLTINNVILGTSLRIGKNCEICAPQGNSDPSFITVYENSFKKNRVIDITHSGLIKIGDQNSRGITIDGPRASIYGGEWSDSQSWYITPTEAKFNNVTVSGSIKASVFEQGIVQAIGGIMLIRPSSSIKQVEKITGRFKKTRVFAENVDIFPLYGYYLLGSNGSNIPLFGTKKTNTKDVNIKWIEFESLIYDDVVGTPLINICSADLYGKPKSGTNVGIGINSSNNDSFIPAAAISIFESELDGNNQLSNRKVKVLLGAIPPVLLGKDPDDEKEYGLYCDNAFLNGRLTTGEKSGIDSFYCGIDAKSSIEVPQTITERYKDKDKDAEFGKILLWAGGRVDESSYSAKVQSSNFWVDSHGNLYAKKAFLDNGVFTNSIINASELRAATIVGTNKDGYALKIVEENILKSDDNSESENSLTAISFVEKRGTEEKEYFSVDKELIEIKTYHGMSLIDGDSEVNFSANKLSFKNLNSSIIIGEEGKEYTKLSREGFFFQKDNGSGKLAFEEESDSFGITLTGSKILNLTKDEIDFEKKAVFKEKLELWGNVTIDKSSGDKGFNGFDLYIGG